MTDLDTQPLLIFWEAPLNYICITVGVGVRAQVSLPSCPLTPLNIVKPPHPPNKTPLLLKENQCEAKSREGEKDLRGGMVSDVLARRSTPDFSRRG